MSTRGAYGIKVDGLYKVAYNHFDAYPGSLGADIAEQWLQLRSDHGSKLKAEARRIKLAVESFLVKPKALAIARAGWELEAALEGEEHQFRRERAIEHLAKFKRSASHAEIVANVRTKLIFAFETGVMIDYFDFLRDSLFCEWAYMVDLDTDHLEVYRGSVKAPTDKGPFSPLSPAKKEWREKTEYWPVKQIARIAPADLEDDWPSKLRLGIDLIEHPDEVDDEASAHERIAAMAFMDKQQIPVCTIESAARSAPILLGIG